MPRRITTTDELRAIIAAGSGYVCNTDGKKLHLATSGWVRGMGLGTPKLALDDAEDAAASLAARRGQTCPNCLGRQILATPIASATLQHIADERAREGACTAARLRKPVGPTRWAGEGVGGVEFAVSDGTLMAWATALAQDIPP